MIIYYYWDKNFAIFSEKIILKWIKTSYDSDKLTYRNNLAKFTSKEPFKMASKILEIGKSHFFGILKVTYSEHNFSFMSRNLEFIITRAVTSYEVSNNGLQIQNGCQTWFLYMIQFRYWI